MSGPAASQLGLHPNPIGTLEELRREQIGPEFVGSCAPPSKGVRGCAAYEQCIFRLTKNGGFRDHGPKNIVYFHETHEGHRHQNFMLCATFMQVLYQRMRAGVRDREDGKNGEIIRIIGQEGDTYRPKLKINANAANPLLPPIWVRDDKARPCPKFPRPGEQAGSEYDSYLAKEEKRYRALDEDMAEGPPVSAKDMEPAPDAALPEAVERALAEAHTGPMPTAAPVERKK